MIIYIKKYFITTYLDEDFDAWEGAFDERPVERSLRLLPSSIHLCSVFDQILQTVGPESVISLKVDLLAIQKLN